jgi:hypothetical protein
MNETMKPASEKMSGKSGKKSKTMKIERLDDGHFYSETHEDGQEKPSRAAHADMKALHAHIDSTWSEEKGASDKAPKLPTSPVKPAEEKKEPPKAK